ncbi:MAG: hypothetical protein Q9203_007502, partial [Teloschistes exilis]
QDASDFKIGDNVFGLAYGGAYAEHIAVSTKMLMRKPEELSWEEAAGIPETWITATQALYLIGGFTAGKSVLWHAGASSVSISGIQLAREEGAGAIYVTASSEEKIRFCVDGLGATKGFNYKTQDWSQEILKETGGKGVDIVVDFVGATHFQGNLNAAARDGRIVHLGAMGGTKLPEGTDIMPFIAKRLRFEGSSLRSRDEGYQGKLRDTLWEHAIPAIREGKMKVFVEKVLPWEGIVEAHQLMESNATKGKIICTIGHKHPLKKVKLEAVRHGGRGREGGRINSCLKAQETSIAAAAPPTPSPTSTYIHACIFNQTRKTRKDMQSMVTNMAKRSREDPLVVSAVGNTNILSDPAPKKRKVDKTKTDADINDGAEKSKLSKEDRRKLKRLRKLEAVRNDETGTGGDGTHEIETHESEKTAAKAIRKAEKARAKAEQLQSSNGTSISNTNGIDSEKQDKARRKAERKAEKDRAKVQRREEENNVNGHVQPPNQDGNGIPKTEDVRPTSPSDHGYQQDPDLTALSETEIQSFLSSNFITIKDPSSHPLRPITKFAYLPKVSGSSAYTAFKSPTPIQASAWPFLFSGRDVIGIAETGSGKTLAFGIPCIRSVSSASTSLPKKSSKKGNPAKALIISPTRELAAQIHDQISAIAAPQNIHTACLYGGVPKPPQQLALETAEIVVATPGRLNDLIEEGSANLSQVRYLVLDEADRMLEKGFEDAIRKIISTTPSTAQGRQTLMFTATWPESVRDLAATFMREPVRITIGENNGDGELRANARIEQKVEVVDPREKDTRVLQIIKQYQSGSGKKNQKDRVLVFCLYKKEATRVENFLRGRGCSVAGIHGDLSQSARMAALEGFKSGACPLLVATDVAARGLDIPNVRLVLNVTFPLTVEDYVHRIGR